MNAEILSNLVISEIYSVATMLSLENSGNKRQKRQRWAIIYKYEGETVYRSGKKNFVSNAEHLMLLPKGCSYEWKCTRTGHYTSIEFECVCELAEPIVFTLQNSEKIAKMIKELEQKRNLKSPTVEMESIRDVYSILIELMRTREDHYVPARKQMVIDPVLEYISHNYRSEISNDTLAEIAGVSTVYFRKLFTALMGVSPIAYARRVRIEKAKELLHSDYSTLTDVALSLGYANLYDFSRDFKKHIGISPSKYR